MMKLMKKKKNYKGIKEYAEKRKLSMMLKCFESLWWWNQEV